MSPASRLLIFLNGFFINAISFELTSLDFQVIDHLSRCLEGKALVYVNDGQEVSSREMKEFSRSDVYHSVVGSSLLGNLLDNRTSQLNFLQTRTVIVAGGSLNLTGLIEKVLFPRSLIWMIFKEFNDHEVGLYIPIDNDVLFVNSTPDLITVKQVYYVKPGMGKTVKTVWRWAPGSGETPKPPLSMDIKKNNFHNVTLDMLVISLKEDCGDKSNKPILQNAACIQQDLLALMGEKLNFSITKTECVDKEFPYILPNGSEGELFVRIRRAEIDFSAATHVLTGRFFYRTDNIGPTFSFKTKMYIRQGRLSGRWGSYLRPLESSVWLGILTWIAFTGILIYFFEKSLASNLSVNVSSVCDLVVSTLKALQVFCNQAVADIPPSYSIRIVYFLTFFVVLIFFQAYCAYLASSLTVVVYRFPFTDLTGFFENHEYRLMVLKSGFHKYYFQKVIGENKNLDFMLSEDELPRTVEEAVRRLCTQDLLSFTEFREDLLRVGELDCQLAEIPSNIAHALVSIATPRPSRYKEMVTRELLYLRSTGILRRLGAHLPSRSEFRDKNSRKDYVTVSMNQIFSIFILLGCGILLSTFIFVLEVLVDRIKKPSLSLEKDMRRFRRKRIYVMNIK